MGTSFVAALWSLLWGASALYNLSNAGSLKPINIALGILFLIVGFIELFGVSAANGQRLPVVRLYATLSILAAVLFIAGEALRFSVYFTRKNDLIKNCTQQATGETVQTYGSFWGNGGNSETLSPADAQTWCNSSWVRSVWSTAAWLAITTILAVFFVMLAFSFYHQLLTPQVLAPSQAYPLGTFGSDSTPYNPQTGYQYPAPSGPPPAPREDYVPPYDPHKVPEYFEGDGPKGFSQGKETDIAGDTPGSQHGNEDPSRNV